MKKVFFQSMILNNGRPARDIAQDALNDSWDQFDNFCYDLGHVDVEDPKILEVVTSQGPDGVSFSHITTVFEYREL